MRIAIFTDIFLEVSGGIPSSIQAQKNGLEKLGHHVTVFCPGSFSKKNLKKNPENIIIIPTHRFIRFNKAPIALRPQVILKYIKNLYPNFSDHFDVIHVHHESSCSLAGVILAKKFHIKLIQTMHGREDVAIDTNVIFPFKYLVAFLLNLMHKFYLHQYQQASARTHKQTKQNTKRSSLKQLPDKQLRTQQNYNFVHRQMWELMVRQANTADIVITPTHHFAQKLSSNGVYRPLNVISNGIDDNLLQKYFLSPKSFSQTENLNIIWNSRVSKEKRIMPFLIALTQTKNLSRIRCTIIGTGNELKKAKSYVKKHHLSKQVSFLDYIPHEKIFSHLVKQHLSVINSYNFDTQGMTILEAISCGIPVLYVDPAMNEVIPKNGGIQVSDTTPESLARIIDYLFDNPELIHQMSKIMLKNQKTVLESTQLKKLLKLYNPKS